MNIKGFFQKLRSARPAVWALDAAGLAGLTAAVVCWWPAGQDAVNYAAALLSAALFAVWGLCYVPRWVEAWGKNAPPERSLRQAEPAAALRVFLALLALDAGLLVLVYALRRLWVGPESLSGSLSFWRCLDSNSYLEIAQFGYAADGDRAVQLVFLPGYPLAVRALQRVVGGDYVYAGLLEAGLCFAGAGVLLYKLTCLDYGPAAARRAVKYLCLFPGVFFYAAPMSESQFLLLSLGCVLCLRKNRWLAACALGGLAAFTRAIGLAMLALACFEWVADAVRRPPRDGRELRRRAGRLAAMLLIPAGFGCYLYINYRVSGDPLRFLYYQREHWDQGLGWFFNTAAYQAGWLAASAREGNEPYVWGLFLPQLLAGFCVPPLLAWSSKKLRPSYGAYALGYYAVAMGCTWLLSAVRYLGAMFCIPLSLALLGERRRTDGVLTAVLGALSAAYLFLFVIRWQVW